MATSLNTDANVLIEIRVGEKNLYLGEIGNKHLQFWSEDELVDLLQHRLGKNRFEISQLLESAASSNQGNSYA